MEQDHEIIPKPSAVTDLKLKPNQVSVLIEIFMPPFRERMNTKI